jgi:hypothetical protein
MAFFGLFKSKPKSEWRLVYTVERFYAVSNFNIATRKYEKEPDSEIITFFLKQDQFGNRKIEHTDYGLSKERQNYKRHDAEMKLWLEAGIVPAGAKNVVMEKLKGTP